MNTEVAIVEIHWKQYRYIRYEQRKRRGVIGMHCEYWYEPPFIVHILCIDTVYNTFRWPFPRSLECTLDIRHEQWERNHIDIYNAFRWSSFFVHILCIDIDYNEFRWSFFFVHILCIYMNIDYNPFYWPSPIF